MEMSKSPIIIFSDFDGTISEIDAHYAILDRFASPVWRDIEAEYLAKHLGSKAAISAQFQLCNVPKSVLDQFLKSEIMIDTSFPSFLNMISCHGIPFFIVSDGLDYVISRILADHNITAPPIYANHLEWLPDMQLGNAIISHPCTKKTRHQYNPHRGLCGTCKTEIVQLYQRTFAELKIIYIGDGETDKCAAGYVDHVFARENSALHEYCRTMHLPHQTFQSFRDIAQRLAMTFGMKALH